MVLTDDYKRDIADVQAIPIVPTILEVVCQTTGMGFAAIARVTDEKWLTCGVLDNISFGLRPGDELEVESTLCHEVRQAESLVAIDHVKDDVLYFNHHTPLKYGFQSYISVPINRKDGTFFGTLCAIDPEPNQLKNEKVIGMFTLFAELIAFHLDALETLREQNIIIEKKELALDSYSFVSSHDLQEPLRKIQTFANLIQDSEVDNLSQRGKEYFEGIGRAATRMRHILKDLLSYSETREDHYSFETVDLKPLVERAASRLREELTNSGASLTIAEMCHIDIVPVQIEQVFYNLLSNAVAFRSPERRLSIDISSTVYMGAQSELSDLVPEKDYLEISVSDNGKGFDQRYADKIFDMFQRLETKNTDRSTGIGLAIAKKIVLDHQGKIIASGEVGKGATIKCYLPLRQ